MGDPQMTLRSEDITQIALQVAPAVRQLLAQDHDPRLQEQMLSIHQDIQSNTETIRLQGVELRRQNDELRKQGEELHLQGAELRAQREVMEARFTVMDVRFDDQRKMLEKRFDDQRHYSDKRFSTLTWGLGLGVTLISLLMTVYQFLG
jgi:hypothetical protein